MVCNILPHQQNRLAMRIIDLFDNHKFKCYVYSSAGAANGIWGTVIGSIASGSDIANSVGK